jgi:hypothetical protein
MSWRFVRLHCRNGTKLPNLPRQHLREQVSVTAHGALLAMTHQGDVSTMTQLLNEPQSELLTMIFDVPVALVEANAAVQELPTVTPCEFRPGDIDGSKKKLFTRP